MAKDAMIHARIESGLKGKAERVFKKLGLSATDAITLFYKQVELQRGLPFQVKIPNRVTRRTLKEADAGKNVIYPESAEEMYRDLGM